MHIDIASLLIAMTVCMVTMAVALPAVMGQVNEPARRAQAGVTLQAAGWACLPASGTVEAVSWSDLTLSTLAMAGITGGFALNATAFDLWCGRGLWCEFSEPPSETLMKAWPIKPTAPRSRLRAQLGL